MHCRGLQNCWNALATLPVHQLPESFCSVLQGVVRAVCAIIDAFHFLPPAEAADTAAGIAADTAATAPPAGSGGGAGADPEVEAHDEDMPEAAAGGADSGDGQQEAAEGAAADETETVAAAAQAADIRSALLKRVLPGLKAQLVAKGDVSAHLQATASVVPCVTVVTRITTLGSMMCKIFAAVLQHWPLASCALISVQLGSLP